MGYRKKMVISQICCNEYKRAKRVPRKNFKISKGRTNLLTSRTKVWIFVSNLESNFEIFIIMNAILKKKVRNMALEIPDVVLNKQITIKGLQHYVNCFYFLIAFPSFHSCV